MKELAKLQPSQPALSFTVKSAAEAREISCYFCQATAGVADLITEFMLPLPFTQTHGFQKFMTLVCGKPLQGLQL